MYWKFWKKLLRNEGIVYLNVDVFVSVDILADVLQSCAVIKQSNITVHITAVTEDELKSEFEHTQSTRYFVLSGWAMMVSFVRIVEKIDHIIMA